MLQNLPLAGSLWRLILAGFLTTSPLWAAPYGPDGRSTEWTQPDGTKLSLKVHGDEFYARTETADGYTVVYDPETKSYHYAQLDETASNFKSTGKLAGKVDPGSIGLKKGLKLTAKARGAKAAQKHAAFEKVVQQNARWESVKTANRNYHSFKKELKKQEKTGKKGFAIPIGTIFPDSQIPAAPQNAAPGEEASGAAGPEYAPPSFTLTGEVVGLTILVDFSDVPGTAVTQSEVDDYFNKPNYTGFGNSGSVYDYFFIQSAGRLRYSNNVTYYVRVPQPKGYYDDTTVDSGLCGRLLLNDALDVLIADGYDFSSLTTKSGGNVRACNIFFAGNDSGTWSKGLWPHRWVLSPSKSVGPGMQIYDYQITNIGTASTLKIGTVCHENGHMILGYPDLYSYDGNAANVSRFSLMGSGNYGGSGYHPTNIDPYLKTASGWADIVELDSASNQRCTVQVDNNQFYRFLNPAESREYFMFEVRDNTGYEGPYGGHSGSVNPATGLLAYHLREHGSNTYSTIFTADNPNADYTKPYEMLVLEANPSTAKTPWYDDPTPGTNDAFKSSDKNQLSDATTPSLKFWDASGRGTNSGGIIHSISADSSVMTFVAGSGAPTGSAAISLSRANLYPSCNFGSNAPETSFAVCNAQSGTLTYTISDDVGWLDCDVTGGSASTESDPVNISFTTSSLAPGSYTGTITVDAGGAGSETITVHLTVWAQPTLAASPGSLNIDGLAGISGPVSEFNLENIGGGNATYSVTNTQPWLNISPNSGSVGGERDSIYATFDATALAAGTYTDTITITSSEASNSPLTIPVTFNVDGTEMLLISPNGGESLFRGTTRSITWNSSLSDDVKIELLKNGTLDTTIAASTTNNGSYSWSVPAGQTLGSDYRIRVSTLGAPSYSDTSSVDFSISAPPTSAVSIPYAESFESGVGDWVQSTTDGMDWTWDSAGTPSTGTGPTAAQDGTYYLYTEASGFTNLNAQLSCWFDLTSSSQPDLSFQYHMNGTSMGTLQLQASLDGSNWDTLFTRSGDQGPAWAQAAVDLNAYAGQYLQLRFSGTTGTSWSSDITIDNVTITQPGFSVIYNGNGSDGGTPPVDSTLYPTSASVTVLGNSGNLTKTANVFNGWNTAANGSGTSYGPGASFNMGSSNVTLYAQWTPVPTYTVSFNGNGHDGGSPPSNQTKTQGVDLALSPANSNGMSRTGYNFSNWNTAANGSGVSYADEDLYTANSAVTLYAQWTVSTYTVAYNGNTNTGGSAPANQTKTYNQNLTLANQGTLVKTGHSFSGWNTAANGSGDAYPADGTYSTNAATTLHAQWSPETYTVSFDANGGDLPSPTSKSVTYGTPYGALATVSRTGFTFMGWFTSAVGGSEITAGTAVAITANQTLYAHWNEKPVANAGPDETIFMTGTDEAWTPADLTLNRWYDASDTASIAESGNAVSQWNDKSGNAAHATQTNINNRPVSGTRNINGKNIIAFDSAGVDFLNMPSTDLIGKEVWAVFLIDDYSASASQLLLGAGGNVQVGVNSASMNLRLWQSSNPYTNDNKSTATVPQSTATFAGWLAHTSTKKFSINGVLETTTDTYTSGSINPNYIGRGQYAYMDGAIGEIVITSGELSIADRQRMEGYLAWKWGMQANLPATHPYSTTNATSGPMKSVASAITTLAGSVTDSDDTPSPSWASIAGGTGTGTVTFSDENALNSDVTFSDTGTYHLRLTADDGNDQHSDVVVITVNLTADYTVTYDGNGSDGGTVPEDLTDYQLNDPVTVLGNTGNLTRSGYTFAGWNTAADGTGTPYVAGNTFNITGATTLYAQWSGNNYAVTLNRQGGSGGSTSVSATMGAAMPAATAPTRSGYSFAGYFTGTNGSGTRYYDAAMNSTRNWDIASATTLHAHWSATSYTVTLNRQGGSGGDGSINATFGQAMPAASAPTRSGYTFGGYYSGTNGSGAQYYTSAMASAANWNLPANTTLYAKWTANTYPVTFDKQGGSGGSNGVSATYDAAMPTATAPSRTGYDFAGYFTGPNGSGTQYYTGTMASAATWTETSGTTLYAHWTGRNYTVTLDKQAGTGGSSGVTATFGSAMPTATAPTRTDYAFGGYYTGTNGSGTQYYSATMTSARNWDIPSDTTLYAKWTPAFTVDFQTDGTTGATLTGTTSQVIGVGGDATPVTANPPANHYFANWTKGGSLFSTDNPLTVTAVAESMTLVANFSPDPSLTIADDGLITEEQEDGEIISVVLLNGTFADPLTPANWTLSGLPSGVTQGNLIRVSDNSAQIVLSGNRTLDYDIDITVLSVTCSSAEIIESSGDTSTNTGVTLTAVDDAESIEIVDDGWILEGAEDGEIITVVLNGGTFAPSLNGANWTVSNLPAGVSKGAVTRINAQVVTIALSGNRTGTYAGNSITNVTVSCSKAEYDDNSGGGSLFDIDGVTMRALGGGTIVLQDGLNGYTGTRDAFIENRREKVPGQPDRDYAGTNYGLDEAIRLSSYSNATRYQLKYGLLGFDLSSIPVGSTLSQVSLELTDDGGTASTLRLVNMTGAWNETLATFNNSNALISTTEYANAPITGTAGSTITMTLNAAGIAKVQSWVNDPDSNHGFGLRTDLSKNNATDTVRTREHPTVASHPKLSLTYTSNSQSGPEINVQGNGISIASGDTTTSSADGTDFGSCILGGPTVVQTFTVMNLGDSALSLNGSPVVSITGTHASDFELTSTPATSVAAAGTTTFAITFTPGNTGLHTASVTIGNDDSDEGSYTFAISATGLPVANPFVVWGGGVTAEGDHNGDGISNGIAWVIGAADPSAAANALLPTHNDSDPDYFVYTYRRHSDAHTDSNTAIRVEYGNDLIGWTLAQDNGDTVIITDGATPIAPGIYEVEVKLKRSLATNDCLFTRLVVTIAN